jgi:hypothetical protein
MAHMMALANLVCSIPAQAGIKVQVAAALGLLIIDGAQHNSK